ncbi:MAG: DUF4381 domain-containing protein [Arenibacterium sp.]
MAELILPPEPGPISLMPQTWAWPILLILVAILAVYVVNRIHNTRRAEAYRATALAALEAAGSHPAKVALVLRQTALTAYPRAKVASLHGQVWLDFLSSTGGQVDFNGPHGKALITLPYSEESELPEECLVLVGQWIRHHDRAIML